MPDGIQKLRAVKYAIIILLVTIFAVPSYAAEDTVRVLIRSDRNLLFPSDSASSITRSSDEIFFKDRLYSGPLDLLQDEDGLYLVMRVPFERYIAAVLANEVTDDWEIEALKAQAVLTRTYALNHLSSPVGKSFDIESDRERLVFSTGVPAPAILHAVTVTRGQVLKCQHPPMGKPAQPCYKWLSRIEVTSMAKSGMNYRDILSHYNPGIIIESIQPKIYSNM
ncbi:MAG: hypothetical protein ISR96_12660 [Nitrospira sp.]|nr:hypothetical protein [bacterium]MBL7050357.1 hypothetical protein [Nitrospira sp.]